MRLIARAAAILAVLCLGTAHAAETTEFIVPDPTLIGGTPAPAGQWPASVYASMGNARCSATVIGERALLIASHCVSNGGTARFSVGANAYQALCSHTPGYPANSEYDWTLCLIDRKVTGIKYESLATGPEGLQVGTSLRLTGYGCIRSGGGGGNDGVFRIGTAPITQVGPSSGRSADIVTRGSAALCYGDSGGAAYLELADGKRVIVGVNSRGNISTTSYLPAVYHSQFKAKIASWKAGNGQKICGVDADAVDCRNGDADPDPDPEPQPSCVGEFEQYEQSLSLGASKFQALKACLIDMD